LFRKASKAITVLSAETSVEQLTPSVGIKGWSGLVSGADLGANSSLPTDSI